MTHARALPLALALIVAACSGKSDRSGRAESAGTEADSLGHAKLLRGRARDGRTTYVRRIDGDVQANFFASIVPPGLQRVVFTGVGSGSDQCSVLVIDGQGGVLMQHRVSGDAPFGTEHHLLMPGGTHLEPFDHGGRRWIALKTLGLWIPYSVEVLEVVGGARLEPRYRFWNPGTVWTPVVGDGLIAFGCLNNTFRAKGKDIDYPIGVAVLSMDDDVGSASTGTTVDAEAPRREPATRVEIPGKGYLRYFLLPEFDHRHRQNPLSVSIDEGRVRAETESGLRYELDPVSGNVGLTAGDTFRREYEKQPPAADAPKDVEDFLVARRAAVRTFVPEGH